ncbi:phosphate signaling complex protein PhoU [Myxococcota bacterium]|nr:phosphate signaling complex protein PhoU [Myxococcota bacterium]MCZ7620543.1 phosphate signaling complex protein PhoU [Myxococcota bacterium]
MSRTLEPFLGEVNDLILRMGGCCEAIVAKSLQALFQRDARLAAEVQDDDLEIDRLDIAVDEAVLRSIALQAPVADDLRRLLAAYDMGTDLERVGDLARNIAKSAARIAERPPIALPASLETLAGQTQAMLRDALDAFVQRDAEQARRLLVRDQQIDEGQDRVILEALGEIDSRPDVSPQQIDLILTAKNLERIADHATNIAESVILVVEGRNVRHADKLARGSA